MKRGVKRKVPTAKYYKLHVEAENIYDAVYAMFLGVEPTGSHEGKFRKAVEAAIEKHVEKFIYESPDGTVKDFIEFLCPQIKGYKPLLFEDSIYIKASRLRGPMEEAKVKLIKEYKTSRE